MATNDQRVVTAALNAMCHRLTHKFTVSTAVMQMMVVAAVEEQRITAEQGNSLSDEYLLGLHWS